MTMMISVMLMLLRGRIIKSLVEGNNEIDFDLIGD